MDQANVTGTVKLSKVMGRMQKAGTCYTAVHGKNFQCCLLLCRPVLSIANAKVLEPLRIRHRVRSAT